MVAIFAPSVMFAQDSNTKRVPCNGITKKNAPCKNVAIVGRNFCWRHDSTYVKPIQVPSVVCSGTKKDGNACSLRTKHSSGLCHHHREQ